MKKTYNQPQTLEIKVQSRHLFLDISPDRTVKVNLYDAPTSSEALTKGDSWYDDDVWGNED